jgi:hypothetical protein
MNNFQKTVDLSGKTVQKSEASSQPRARVRAAQEKEEVPAKKKRVSRARGIDQVYSEKEEKKRNEFQQIERAPSKNSGQVLYKILTIIFGLILIAVFIYFIYVVPKTDETPINTEIVSGWFIVELINGEVYYGQIDDIGANPIAVKNVYSNYNQLNLEGENKQPDKSKDIKLIKRGDEVNGASGNMLIYQTQIEKIDQLQDDSPILKAILNNEK